MRRALAIEEASLGADHPDVAIGLNNLDTNLLAEGEPLMRKQLVIFLRFRRDTGHPHPHRDTVLRNYTILLSELGRDEAAIRAAIESAHREAGLDREAPGPPPEELRGSVALRLRFPTPPPIQAHPRPTQIHQSLISLRQA
jgi:hypothetical protein